MPNYRCKYNQIWDSNTRRYRNCKNKKFLNLCYCAYHSRKIYDEYVIKIQKVYKGYYIRKKLKIYYNLPRDLQRKIIWHINKNLYLKQFNSSISKIIYKRFETFYNNEKYKMKINQFYNLLQYTVIGQLQLFISIENNFIYDLLSIIKLAVKYEKIIDIFQIIEYIKFKYVTRVLHYSKYIYNDKYNHELLDKFNKMM